MLEFLNLALEFMDLVIYWIQITTIVFITSSLVGVSTVASIVQSVSEILVAQLIVQMITKITVVATFRMGGSS